MSYNMKKTAKEIILELYICDAIDRAFEEKEMSDIMPGVFIAPNEPETFKETGVLVYTKDDDGNIEDCAEYCFEGVMPNFSVLSDLLTSGREILDDIVSYIIADWA